MNDSATRLDNLHDIVLPAPVPWWPPAAGWYALLLLLIVLSAWLGWRAWNRWRADAYRRAALRELAATHDASAIAAVLRRTALARVPRPLIAVMTGSVWVDWLAAQGSFPMPADVRHALVAGVYDPDTNCDIGSLRDYAAHWIAHHHPFALKAPEHSRSIESQEGKLTR